MLVIAISSRRPPLRAGELAIASQAAAVDGQGLVGDDLVYANWNELDKSANIDLTDFDLTATANTSAAAGVRADQFRDEGRWYFEIYVTTSSGTGTGVGLATGAVALASVSSAAADAVVWLGNGSAFIDENFVATLEALAGHWIGVHYDADAKLVWFTAPGMDPNNDEDADPETGEGGYDTSGFDVAGLYPIFVAATNGDNATANFGESPFNLTKSPSYLPWIGGSITTGVSGVGALSSGVSTADGTGAPASTGTGELEDGASTMTGVGSLGDTGHLSAGASDIDGTGTSRSTGTGALASGASDVDGTGTSGSTGTGELESGPSTETGSANQSDPNQLLINTTDELLINTTQQLDIKS